MFPILARTQLRPNIVKLVIHAPLIAKKALPGQFVILRAFSDSERIPLTIADQDKEVGSITIIFQTVGEGTMELASIPEGDSICDLSGPLGRPTELEGLKRAIVIGGGVGSAIAYPIAKYLHNHGCHVHSIVGFRSKDYIILEDEFRAVSDEITFVTDDGSFGKKALVTEPLKEILETQEPYDMVIAIGPLVMMKFVSLTTLPFEVKTIVSMNPIMIDGTGMCGGCRLTVGGESKFACVDGPDFDGHQVDFDEAIARGRTYADAEAKARDKACNLLSKEVQ